MVAVSFASSIKKDHLLPHRVAAHEFVLLESPHPCGVLPSGNRFLLSEDDASSDQAEIQRQKANESCPALQQLDEEIWGQVLSFCDGHDVARTVQTCRWLYVLGHEQEVWRDLVLRRQHCRNEAMEIVGATWKETYVKLLQKHKNGDENPPSFTSKSLLQIPGCYSDVLYRLHRCRSFSIPKAWYNLHATGPSVVPRIPVEDMSSQRFAREFEGPNRPVVLAGAAKSWKAFQKWKDPSYLLQQTQQSKQTFRATSGAAPLPAQFTLQAYLDYCQNSAQLEEAPLYLFDRTALQPGSVLHEDYYPDLQRTCPYWDPAPSTKGGDIVGHDLFNVLGEGARPDHTWLIVGPQRSGSVFHIDPNATHAWNAAIVGRKKWIFYPPGVAPPGVHPSPDGDSVALPLSLGEWLLQFWDEHLERHRTAPPSERPIECTVEPGDVIFVPHGWWHLVVNLDEGLNVAITHNYVSRSNLSNVLRFIQVHNDQVSGCRDRKESVKPDRLYRVWVEALHKQFQGTCNHAQWLQDATALAKRKWTCGAWKNHDDNDNNEDGSENSDDHIDDHSKENPKKRPLGNGDNHDGGGSSIMMRAKASGNVDSNIDENINDKSSAIGNGGSFSFSFL